MSETARIERLAHGGDGATAEGVFVPYTVPGDVVRIAREGGRGRLLEIVTPGPSRADAVCRHFGRCGGCAVQHLQRDIYLAWKRDLVVTALAQRGFSDVAVDGIRAVAPGTRRRAMFKAKGLGKSAAIGFYEAGSRQLVDISACPVLVPELEKLLAPLRAELGALLKSGETAELHATAADNGVDLSLRLKRGRDPDLLMRLAALASRLKLARLSWNGEPVSIAREPRIAVGRFSVVLPSEAFLQPTKEGEHILQDLVKEGVRDAVRVADLFAGCGTFALSLAQTRTVHALDHGGAMLATLQAAAREGGADVKIEERDLFRRPVTAEELARFDAVVLDPPRPGARAQAQELARSAVSRIVYVSCNPASFARDARILHDGQYRLARVTPVDQFLWSAHVELVGVFERDG